MEIVQIRTALLISLSILLVVILYRRFKRRVKAESVPVPLHVELLRLEVTYHPARLHVELLVPGEQTLTSMVLDAEHHVLHHFPVERLRKGRHGLDLQLPELSDGLYHLQLDTGTQRTVRQFRLRST